MALRRRIASRHGGTVLEQGASAYERESMGLIENGIKLGKGILRVLLFALEDRIRGRLPCALPAFSWLVGHSSAVLTKHFRSKDGKTPYQRLFGKDVSEEGLEFGEKVRYRLPRGPSHNVLLEARWQWSVARRPLGRSRSISPPRS